MVFIGPYEHHSNEIPWRERHCRGGLHTLNKDGVLDLTVLEAQLKIYQHRHLKMGSFSAASNVTGLKLIVHAVTRLLHKYQLLHFGITLQQPPMWPSIWPRMMLIMVIAVKMQYLLHRTSLLVGGTRYFNVKKLVK